jgi:hypothetical protein
LPSQGWNDDFRAVLSITAPDPAWWTANINTEIYSGEVHRDCRMAPASVLFESPRVFGTESVSAAFRPTSPLLGFDPQLFDFNVPVNLDFDFNDPNSLYCIVFENPISPVQLDWDSLASSSSLRSDCDSSSQTRRVSTPPGNEILGQELQGNPKRQIPALRPFPCPHCSKLFSSEQLLKYAPHLPLTFIIC